MAVQTRTFTQLLESIAAAVQGRASGLVDFSVGAIVRAVSEAFSGTVLFLQAQVLALLATTRAETSEDTDLDSFVADFGAAPTADDETLIERLGAGAAKGSVTFGRLTTTGQVVVPVGATVATQDGAQTYAVDLDTLNPAYNAGLGGYVLAIGVASVVVKVTAITAGSGGNAVAGAINTITSAIPGVDSVTNAAAFTTGVDAETDPQFRVRFRKFIKALREATPPALEFAVESLQRGITCKIVEKALHDGTPRKAYFYALVDDGTGFPTSDLLTSAGAALDRSHAAGLEFAVYAPTVVTIAVTADLVFADGTSDTQIAQAIADAMAAIADYLNTLPIGQNVYWSKVWQVIQDSSEDIVELTGLLVAGGSVDVVMTVNQVAKAGTLTFS